MNEGIAPRITGGELNAKPMKAMDALEKIQLRLCDKHANFCKEERDAELRLKMLDAIKSAPDTIKKDFEIAFEHSFGDAPLKFMQPIEGTALERCIGETTFTEAHYQKRMAQITAQMRLLGYLSDNSPMPVLEAFIGLLEEVEGQAA